MSVSTVGSSTGGNLSATFLIALSICCRVCSFAFIVIFMLYGTKVRKSTDNCKRLRRKIKIFLLTCYIFRIFIVSLHCKVEIAIQWKKESVTKVLWKVLVHML